MRLTELSQVTSSGYMASLSQDRELASGVQEVLIGLGLLDPPVDGWFGPLSKLAWQVFLETMGEVVPNGWDGITPAAAGRLLQASPEALFPVTPTASVAGAVWQAMEATGYWLARAPGWINIVYVEGVGLNGVTNGNAPNRFNDLRLVISVQEGRPVVLGRWTATTEPGKFFTENPLNRDGAARIAFGQYKAWKVGTHGQRGAHEALVQRGEIRVHRDLNRDFSREGDAEFSGAGFGINQHWGYDLPEANIGKASAGCLVGRTRAGHRRFMELVKSDPRYRANPNYMFFTTVLSAADIGLYLMVS